MKRILNWLREFVCNKVELPVWAYAMDCEVCKKTFVSPDAHFKYVADSWTQENHKGKILKLLEG